MSLSRIEARERAEAEDHVMLGLSNGDAARLLARLFKAHRDDPCAIVAEAWLFGATAARNVALGRRTCRICGCWELEACDDGGQGCAWVEPDRCTVCGEPPLAGLLEA